VCTDEGIMANVTTDAKHMFVGLRDAIIDPSKLSGPFKGCQHKHHRSRAIAHLMPGTTPQCQAQGTQIRKSADGLERVSRLEPVSASFASHSYPLVPTGARV
jgi:hypothetical protein